MCRPGQGQSVPMGHPQRWRQWYGWSTTRPTQRPLGSTTVLEVTEQSNISPTTSLISSPRPVLRPSQDMAAGRRQERASLPLVREQHQRGPAFGIRPDPDSRLSERRIGSCADGNREHHGGGAKGKRGRLVTIHRGCRPADAAGRLGRFSHPASRNIWRASSCG